MENTEEYNVDEIKENIIKSIENIYAQAEKIIKVDKERANWILERVEELRIEVKEQKLIAVQILSKIMDIQSEIISFMDSDLYKQTTMDLQKYNESKISESQTMAIQVYDSEKNKGFIDIILEKIKEKLQNKTNKEKASTLENTPAISQIANIVAGKYELQDEDGFVNDFRYPVYEFLMRTKKRMNEGEIKDEETISLGSEGNYIQREKERCHPAVYLDYEYILDPASYEYFIGPCRGLIGSEELYNLLEFSEFLNCSKEENELKAEILKALRKYRFSNNLYTVQRAFKKTLNSGEKFPIYKKMYDKALKEFDETSAEFYYQRDEAKGRYKRNIKNSSRVDSAKIGKIPDIESNDLRRNIEDKER